MRSEVILNIGLEDNPFGYYRAKCGDAAMVEHAAEKLAGLIDKDGLDVYPGAMIGVSLFEPGGYSRVTEPTIVVSFDVEPTDHNQLRSWVEALCITLHQGAIAYRVDPREGFEDAQGFLVGPRAAEWGGEFNEAYFEDGAGINPLARGFYVLGV